MNNCIPDKKKRLFTFLFVVTIVTSVIAIPFFIFTSYMHYDYYLNEYDGCGWSIFGRSPMCEIVDKYGADKVHLSNFRGSMMVILTNFLDIIGIVLLKIGNRNGLKVYSVSLLMYIVGYIVISKYSGMANMIVILPVILYYFLVKSCVRPVE